MPRVGAQQIPFALPASGLPTGDIGLGYLGQFLKAALNRAGVAIWGNSGGVCRGRSVVDHVYYHDPANGPFDELRLPALYVWRGSVSRKRIGDGLFQKLSQIDLGWIAEPAQEEHLIVRSPSYNAFMDAVDSALILQRDPAFIVTGDTDPDAAGKGSLINKHTGFDEIKLSNSTPKQFTFERVDGDGKPLPFFGFTIAIDVTEFWYPDTPVDANESEATITTNSDIAQTWTVP